MRLVLAILAIALASGNAAAADKVTVLLDWFVNPDHAAFVIAKEKGMFEKAGLDVEIIERQHRFKEDAPSGTALQFGRIVAEQMGQEHDVHGRDGRVGQRPLNEIGYHAVRTGDNAGEHTIVFGMMGETIDLTVRGHTRDSYAYGALAAAKYVVSQGAGLYSMADVLGL